MKSLTRGNIKAAVNIVRATRWRSLFTVLGVVIGILSVVTMASIGEGVKRQIVGQVNSFGKDLITIRPGTALTGNASSLLGLLAGPESGAALTANDLAVAQSTPGVKVAVPFATVPGAVSVDDKNTSNVIVLGTSDGAPSVLNQTVQFGGFFSSDDLHKNVAVIGANLAQSLFGSDAPLGQQLTFHGQVFLVRGVFNSFDIPPFSLDANFNNAIFIPYPVAQSLTSNQLPVYEILVKPQSLAQVHTVAQRLQTQLTAAHGGQADFSVLEQDQSLQAASRILNLLTNLISGIAAISLLVGGIGIMNIMLVAVSERTHEIGIRKAIGATNRQIRGQFLTEAVMLSLVGGFLGIILSLLVNVVLRLATNLTPVISWRIMLLAVGVTVTVGIVFGIMPAVKAAHKDPIDALREG